MNLKLNSPDITVIVPCYRDVEGVINCISLINDQDYAGSVDIYVVDNSEFFTLEDVQSTFPNVTFLWEKKPGSYNARNKALLQVSTPLIAFIDSDCSARKDWLRQGVSCLISNPKIGEVGGQINIIPKNVNNPSIAELFEMVNGFPQDIYVEKEHFAATANVFTTAQVIRHVGAFDGSLKSGGDHEWGLRVYNSGYKQQYCKEAIVDHPARDHKEILAKLKRTVSGARDRNSSWRACCLFFIRYLIPPRKRIVNIWKSQNISDRFILKFHLSIYAYYINLLAAFYRIKIQITRSESPR